MPEKTPLLMSIQDKELGRIWEGCQTNVLINYNELLLSISYSWMEISQGRSTRTFCFTYFIRSYIILFMLDLNFSYIYGASFYSQILWFISFLYWSTSLFQNIYLHTTLDNFLSSLFPCMIHFYWLPTLRCRINGGSK